jgi:hypothetical protein
MLTQAMPFFATPGAFAQADKLIPNQSYQELKMRYEAQNAAGNNAEAILCAEKAVILYGISGIMLYIPVQLKILQEEKNDGEIIDQALIAVLSILFFAKRYIQESGAEAHQELQCLEHWETQLLSLTDSLEMIKMEASFLSEHYCRMGLGTPDSARALPTKKN